MNAVPLPSARPDRVDPSDGFATSRMIPDPPCPSLLPLIPREFLAVVGVEEVASIRTPHVARHPSSELRLRLFRHQLLDIAIFLELSHLLLREVGSQPEDDWRLSMHLTAGKMVGGLTGRDVPGILICKGLVEVLSAIGRRCSRPC
jgi:hypothetical protein